MPSAAIALDPARGIGDHLSRATTIVVALTLVYVAVGVGLVWSDAYLNDEGLLTHYWGSWARQEFLAIFFFQRLRPVLAALYAPITGLGVHATLVAHVVIASLSIPLIAGTAKRLHYRLPNLAAFAVALSPILFAGAAAGLSNTDGVVGVCLTLWLLSRRQLLLAGTLAGMLPWIRFELGLFSAILAGHALLVRADRRLLLGLWIFPVLYAASGALYHGDALWFVHYPPNVGADPSNPMWQGQARGVRLLLEPLLAVTPLVPLLAVLPWTRLTAMERTLLIYVVVGALVMNVFPVFQIGNFGTAPRYSLHLLPAIALLAARAVESWWDTHYPSLLRLSTMGLLTLWLATRQESLLAVLACVGWLALLLGALRLRQASTATMLALVLVFSGPLLGLRTEVNRTDTAPHLEATLRWLRAQPEPPTIPILTNIPILAAYLAPRVPGLDVRFMAGVDMTGDSVLINPHNGQQQSIGRVAHDLYGTGIFQAVKPTDYPKGAVFVLADDPRLPTLLPEPIWGSRLQVIEEAPGHRIARLPGSIG